MYRNGRRLKILLFFIDIHSKVLILDDSRVA